MSVVFFPVIAFGLEYSYFKCSEGRKQYIFSPNTNYNFIPNEDDLDLLS
jgi:hypothetical protein